MFDWLAILVGISVTVAYFWGFWVGKRFHHETMKQVHLMHNGQNLGTIEAWVAPGGDILVGPVFMSEVASIYDTQIAKYEND